MKKTIEEILGIKSLPKERSVPGLTAVEGREYCYVECSEEDFDQTFRELVRAVTPAIPSFGGALTGGCELTIPDGRRFHAMSYKGDLEGWRKQIELGAKALGIATAKLVGEILVTSSSTQFPISSCKVRFY